MKKICTICLLWVSCFAFSQDVDVFISNHTIQNQLKKYNMEYKESIQKYMGDWYEIDDSIKGSVYAIDHSIAEKFVREYLNRKIPYYAFKIEENFGMRDQEDLIAIVTIEDQIELLKFMQIQGNDFEISNEDIINWFIKWNTDFSYRIIGVGIDFIEADIITEPTNYSELAKEIYSMCPDVVEQGTNTVKALAEEMKKTKSLYFWWD